MSLSSTTLEQREKEAEALRSFLIYSFIGSVVLHIGLIALGMSNFWIKFPQVKDEPIEVAIIEAPNQEILKISENPRSPKTSGNSAGGGGGGGNSLQQQTTTKANTASVISVVKQPRVQPSQQLLPQKTPPITSPIKTSPQQPTTPTQTSPEVVKPAIANESTILDNISRQNLINRLKTPPSTQIVANTSSKPAATTIPTVPVPPTSGNSSNPQPSASERSGTSSTNSPGNAIAAIANTSGIGIGNGTGNGVGNGIGNGIGNGTSNGVGNGTGNQPKKEDTTVATAPKLPTENNSRLERADCVKCDIKYPDRARRRGVEGNPEIAVDTDDNGKVTRVRLIRSSGDRELDEAAQRAAQEWQLKPTSGGRQGVRTSVNFAIKGSQRHRELQERQRQRETAQKKPETRTAVATPTPTDTTQPRQRSTAGVVKDIPLDNPTRRRRESAPSSQATPRKRTESGTTNPPQETTPHRPQQIEPNESRAEALQRRRRRLEDILRRPKTSNSQEGNAERLQRRRKRLEELLRRPKPAASPTTDAPAPSSKPPTDSNTNSTNTN